MDPRATVILRVADRVVRAAVVRGSGDVLLVRGPAPKVGQPLEFAVEGAGVPARALRGAGTAALVGSVDSGLFALRILRLCSGAGVAPIKGFLRDVCGLQATDVLAGRLDRVGHFWWYIVRPEGALERHPRQRSEEIGALLEELGVSAADGLYLRQPVLYLAPQTPYPGRVVRLTHNTAVVQTRSTLPPLGALVHLQLSVDCGLVDRYAVLRGGVARRAGDRTSERDGAKAATVQSGRFEVKIYDVEDLERPGVFARLVRRAAAERAGAEPPPARAVRPEAVSTSGS